MNIRLDESKYAKVSPELRERFFSFVHSAELREVQSGPWHRQYVVFGAPARPVLLFFTGGVKHPIFSFAVIAELGRLCRVVAPVQPPCNTLEQYFEGVDAILDREAVGRFHLAGSSWGGQLAQVAALKYRNTANTLLLANTGVSSGRLYGMMLRLHRRQSAKKQPDAVTEEFRVRALKLLDDSPEARAFWTAVFDDLYGRLMGREDYLTLIDTQIDYVERCAPRVLSEGFSGPVLILAAKNETAGTHGMRRALMRAYPHAQIHQLESGGHHPALLHPEEYRQAVEAFLSEELPAPTSP